ncbi:MAG: AAA family ATPase [Acidobacteria bacterium]|nr:AAA family ATPase [Acidobacteriota bacterium]
MGFDKQFNPEELKQYLQKKYGSGVQVEFFPKVEQEGTSEDEHSAFNIQKVLAFNYKPREIREYLDRYVIQQDDAKKVLSTAVCDHYHHIQGCSKERDCRDYKKQNIILMGPTGVGKTYLIQNLARLVGVPFVKADATKYSETGYVGGDVDDLIRELVHQAGGDIQLAEYGIVYLDEIDKLATPINVLGRDVSGHGVQRGLLKLMEETEVPLRSPTDVASQMQAFMEFQAKGKLEKKTINTRHILFIVSGAFTGLSEIIKRRIGAKQIGFMGEKTTLEREHFLFSEAQSCDFIEYGFEAEFIGRLPVVVHCNALEVADFFNILKYSEGSILKQYKRDFLSYGIEIFFTDDAMMAIAERAQQERTGARGLMTVCEKLFRDYKYVLPDHPVKEFVVNRETVENPEGKLQELMANPKRDHVQVVQFRLLRLQEEFAAKYGIQIQFTRDAAELLSAKAEEGHQDVLSYCNELFRDYEHGLNLLRKSSGRDSFVIDSSTVMDPAGTLERWIRENYR